MVALASQEEITQVVWAIGASILVPVLTLSLTSVINSLVYPVFGINDSRKVYFLNGPDLAVGAIGLCLVWLMDLIINPSIQTEHLILLSRMQIFAPVIVIFISFVTLFFTVNDKLSKIIQARQTNSSAPHLHDRRRSLSRSERWEVVRHNLWGMVPFGICSAVLLSRVAK